MNLRILPNSFALPSKNGEPFVYFQQAIIEKFDNVNINNPIQQIPIINH